MKTIRAFLAIVAVGSLATAAMGQDPLAPNELPPLPNGAEFLTDAPLDDLGVRIKALEDAWDAHMMSLSESKKKAEEDKRKKELEAKSKPTFKLGGRIHGDAWFFPQSDPGIGFFEHPSGPLVGQDPEDRLAFRRVRLEFQGDLLESMFWRLQVDFASPHEPVFKDVYIGFDDVFGQKLIIGNQKRPLGLDTWNSSRFNIFLERPMIIEDLNADARRLGIAMHGVTEDEFWNWQYGVYNLEDQQVDGAYVGDHLQLSANGRLACSPIFENDGEDWMHLAIAGMVAVPDGNATAAVTNVNEARFRSRPEGRSASAWIDTGRIAGAEAFEILGLEYMQNFGPLHVCGEYQFNWLQRNAGMSDLFLHGAYFQVGYFLTGEHMTLKRESGQLDRVKPIENFFLVDHLMGEEGNGLGAWQVAARYSYADFTDADVMGGVGQSMTFALNWHWNAYAKLQFNAIGGRIDDRAAAGGYTSGDYWILGTRFAVDF
ncbi:MAG: ATPase [Planctomycetaceae bacterium]|nr:ATPase [Planctomycetaceae bacterium]MCB9953672.1 ATPase [Planctomycetaceae bacterium]